MDTVGVAWTVIETSSKTGGHVPLVTVHRNTDVPGFNAVMVVLERLGEVIVPEPEILVQVPLMADDAAIWVPELQMIWSGPALGVAAT